MINLANCPITVGNTSLPLTNRYSQVVNVRDFGAKGNGVDDDWASITAAIAAANMGGSGGTLQELHFPAGHYMISQSLILRTVNSGMISGDGAGSTRITHNGPLVVNARSIPNPLAPSGTTKIDAVFDTDGFQHNVIRDITLEIPPSTIQSEVANSNRITSCLNLDRWSSPIATHGNTFMDMIFIGSDTQVGAGASTILGDLLGSEMAYIHCKFRNPTWHAIKTYSANALSHHAWFCHFLDCGTTPTVAGQNLYATIDVARGSMVAAMFCIFENSKDVDVLPAPATMYMIACHHRNSLPKNIDNGPSMWVGGGGIRGQGLTFENTTADDTMIFQKGSANVLDVCDFKTGLAGNGEDYMMSSYKACTFGKASPFANTGRNTVFVDDQFLKGPGALTPLVTGAPIIFTPSLTATA